MKKNDEVKQNLLLRLKIGWQLSLANSCLFAIFWFLFVLPLFANSKTFIFFVFFFEIFILFFLILNTIILMTLSVFDLKNNHLIADSLTKKLKLSCVFAIFNFIFIGSFYKYQLYKDMFKIYKNS